MINNTAIHDGNNISLVWEQWQKMLLTNYQQRIAAFDFKGIGSNISRCAFTAIYFQPEKLPQSGESLLETVLTLINQEHVPDPQFDDLAMVGHRIGMVESLMGMKQYLQNVSKVLKPDGQILFTILNIPSFSRQKQVGQTPIPASLAENQVQNKKLIGPFFNLVFFSPGVLEKQASMANWQYKLIYRQDDTNFAAQLE
jgi:hypothetical protein